MRGFERSRSWLVALMGIHLILLFDALQSHRIPAGHDGFQYFGLQYYFLNNAVQSNEIAQWMPYMTQGTVASWWYAVSTSLMQGVYFLIAPLLKAFNFADLFAVSIYVDHLLLVVGCWLWSSYYLTKDWARFIFCIAVSLTTVWWLQPWHNFHSYFALPLILYFLHMGYQWRRWTYVFLAGSLLLLQCLGQMPYEMPYTVMLISIYMAMMLLFNQGQRYGRKVGACVRYKVWIVLGLLAFLGAAYAAVVGFGTKEIVSYNIGRLANGSTTLDTFLHYGGNAGLARWKEWWIGISPEMDNTLYAGLLLVPLVLWGLCFNRAKAWLAVFITAVLLADFANAGVVAKVAYFCWPGMKFFRHTPLTAVVVKLLMCLLAAMSLEAWVSIKEGVWRKWVLVAFVAIVFICQFNIDRDVYDQLMISMTDWGRARLWYLENLYKPLLDGRLLWLKVLAAGYVLIIAINAALKPRFRSIGLALIVLWSLLDVGLYYFHETTFRSFNATKFLQGLKFEPLPFFTRRVNHALVDNPRQVLLEALPITHHPYWTNETFSMTDNVGHPGRTDHWLKGFDRLLRAYWRLPQADFRDKPAGVNLETAFHFPLTHQASQVWSGYSADKIMLFNRVARCPDQSTVAFFMTHGDYRGYVPFTVDHASMFACLENLLADRRLPLTWQVSRFDANHLWLDVDAARSGWLTYSDGWHPAWRASVDRVKLPVAPVNLAYKMIALEQGKHQVRFDFYNKFMAFAQGILCWLAAGWLIILGVLLGQILRRGDEEFS